MVKIKIDEKDCPAEEGMTVLQVARANGIRIPTLCYHPSLKPSGSCRLCVVEVPGRSSGRQTTMLSCILKVKNGMMVKTDSKAVNRVRTRAFKNLLQMAPHAQSIMALAKSFGIDPGPPPDGCIRCRLCVRVCKEIVGPGALRMEKRDGVNYAVPIEGLCIGCGTCANICPTKVILVDDRDNIRTIKIRDEVIGEHPLQKCEGCGKLYATPKFLDHIQKRTSSHTEMKSPHNYCSTCAKLFSDRVQSLGKRVQQ